MLDLFTEEMNDLYFIEDEAKKAELVKKLLETTFKEHFTRLEKNLRANGGPWMAGAEVCKPV